MPHCLTYFVKIAKNAEKRLQFRVDIDSGQFQQSHTTLPNQTYSRYHRRFFFSSLSISSDMQPKSRRRINLNSIAVHSPASNAPASNAPASNAPVSNACDSSGSFWPHNI